MEFERDVFREALEKAREDLRGWLGRRADADRKIAQLKQTINSLAQMLGEEPYPESNQESLFDIHLSDQILEVIKAANTPLSPVQIKEGLIRLADYKPKEYTNFMATIHSLLKRLEAKKIIESVGTGRQKAYQLKLRTDSKMKA